MSEAAVAPKGSAPVPAAKTTSSWLKQMSRFQLACLLIGYLTILHALGLYWFTKGFLLTRVSLPNVSEPYEPLDASPIAAAHPKAVVVVIDALRTDFLVSHDPESPSFNPHFHNVLTLPSHLTSTKPSHSLLFNSYSDPPTTTMQRLKGITTGSLPTFIEAGFNFASTEIAEDSLIAQLQAHGKKIGFMGDDTWKNLFPSLFVANMTWPFDSFNVEDLHSVDEGVMGHLLPLLHPDNASSWDVLIGHGLGVDHVGHRVGPDSHLMAAKLKQMDEFLAEIVEKMDDETLLVVLGDHGMDERGDHGGDGENETSAALWFYSKGKPLTDMDLSGLTEMLPALPAGPVLGKSPLTRRVNQIDLVPTLSILLGVPIPFNNLGAIIPELFLADGESNLEAAMRQNAKQIKAYIDSYGGDIGRASLADTWAQIEKRVGGDDVQSFLEHREFAIQTLAHLRARWAQFSFPEMLVGLVILGLSVPTALALYTGVRNTRGGWNTYASEALEIALRVGVLGGSLVGTIRGAYTRDPGQALLWAVTSGAAVSELGIIVPLAPAMLKAMWTAVWTRPSLLVLAGPLLLLAHSISFGANSFILWEDRMVNFFLASLLLLPSLKAFSATVPRLRLRILLFSIFTAILARAIAMSTICREEQQPYCKVTFYNDLPTYTNTAAILAVWYLPLVINMFLKISKADSGPAGIFLQATRFTLVAAAFYWTLEWAEGWSGIQAARVPLIKVAKVWLARLVIGITLGTGSFVWSTMPLCINIVRQPSLEPNGGEEVVVYGFANSYGSSYLLFLLVPFTLIFLANQPAAQIVLAISVILILSHLETVDAQKDSKSMALAFAGARSPGEFDGDSLPTLQPSFTNIATYALLGHAIFFATGHQAVLSSIQWKAAFVGVTEVVIPYSPMMVIINTWGGFLLVAIAAPLLACWNVSPRPSKAVPVLADALQIGLGMLVYFSSLTVGGAVCSAWLRRHLMVWNVFAPRFMLAGVTLLIVDVGLLIGVGIGLNVVSSKVRRTYKSETF